MDVLEHLVEEHRKVERLIAKLEATSVPNERRSIMAELGDSLATHMAVEEERVYPIIDEVLGRCPAVTVLATSREALAIPDEVQVTVGPRDELTDGNDR